MIEKMNIKINLTPAILLYKDNTKKASLNGTIFLYHGLTSCKEANLKELESLAKQGYLAVGLDNYGHGERQKDEFLPENIDVNTQEGKDKMIMAVNKTAQELPNIINGLHFMGITQGDKIGVCGISMGAFIVYAALLREKRIKAACSILGSPYFSDDEYDDSPHMFTEKIYPTPILSLNGSDDDIVCCKYAKEFHENLHNLYKECPQNQKYIEYDGENHFFTEQGWNKLWTQATNWFDIFLMNKNHENIDAYTQITEKYKKK
ncbi:MAG: alpha/beta hydrolase [Candidatus Muirbacterium halophilum]|nr:alpha/beta hydrolase [Candidatus Muirbacterium halophilum]MCK9475886.1 alpha/beta hydrolase [Candidatus Muirbacterium halophilum]